MVETTSRARLALFVLGSTAAYALACLLFVRLSDTAYYEGDAWEYQSMAVNFAAGHGIQRSGGIEPWEAYRFEIVFPQWAEDNRREFFDAAGDYDFFRTPAYPLVLGALYWLAGVRPAIAKLVQLIWLAAIAAVLPLIGRRYWGRDGFYGGVAGGALFMAAEAQMAERILTEPLIAVAALLALLALMHDERRRSTGSAALVGLSLGFALLVKGSFAFLPPIVAGLMLADLARRRGRAELLRLAALLAAAAAVVLPWSVYASTRAGTPVLISTQGGRQLLMDNNERCVDGRWHPEYALDPTALYNIDGIREDRAALKVVNFYWRNPGLLPLCTAAKLVAGFGPMTYLWLYLWMAASALALRAAGHRRRSALLGALARGLPLRVPAPMLALLANFVLITAVFHGEQSAVTASRFIAPIDFIFALLLGASAATLTGNIVEAARLQPEHLRRPTLLASILLTLALPTTLVALVVRRLFYG